jgi:hypothetical protein
LTRSKPGNKASRPGTCFGLEHPSWKPDRDEVAKKTPGLAHGFARIGAAKRSVSWLRFHPRDP